MKRKLKNLIKGLLKVLPIRFSRNQRYDAQTLEVMRRVLHKDSNAVDVGGHDGDILKEMIRFAPNGTHYCFEPIPVFAHKLRSKFPNAKVFEMALADAKGETTFQYVKSNPAYSGLKKRQYTGEERIEEINVKIEKLDDIIPEKTPVHLIKIDVEGGELGVLKGAHRIIEQWKPVVIFEHGKGASEFYKTTPEDVFNFFDHSGMKISLLENFIQGGKALSKTDFIEQYEKEINYYFIAHS